MNEINSRVTMMLSCGWGGRTRRSGGKPPGISWRETAEELQSCRLCSSSFLNSLVPKKVSAQQIADEITRLLSLFPGPARHQSDSFALQLRVTRGKGGICRPVWGISATEKENSRLKATRGPGWAAGAACSCS